MFKRLCRLYIRKKTKNLTRIPLFMMTFNYRKYKADGKKGSCMFYTHPDIAKDEFVLPMLPPGGSMDDIIVKVGD